MLPTGAGYGRPIYGAGPVVNYNPLPVAYGGGYGPYNQYNMQPSYGYQPQQQQYGGYQPQQYGGYQQQPQQQYSGGYSSYNADFDPDWMNNAVSCPGGL